MTVLSTPNHWTCLEMYSDSTKVLNLAHSTNGLLSCVCVATAWETNKPFTEFTKPLSVLSNINRSDLLDMYA